MSKDIFERQFAKLKLGKHTSDIEHYKELAKAGYYTEAFLAMWILVEAISKKIQITYRASVTAEKISGSLLKKLRVNDVDIEKNNLRNQIIDILFFQVKQNSWGLVANCESREDTNKDGVSGRNNQSIAPRLCTL